MMGLGGGPRKAICTALFLYLSLSSILVGTDGQATSCSANTVLPTLQLENPVTVDSRNCFNVPVSGASPSTSYTLWYQRNSSSASTTLSVILSVPQESEPRWYAMGFNSAGSVMPNTAAIIFWLNNSEPLVDTYYITAQSAAAIAVDHSRITYGVQPQVVVSDSIYLAFEIENADDAAFSYQNFAIGQANDIPVGSSFTSEQLQHDGVSSIIIDFSANQVTLTTSDTDSKRRTHGALNVIGWGVLLPLGAMIARYAKAFDPHWFYAHALFQVVGYAFVLAGLITGSNLLDDLPGTDADTHKGLAIFVFVLATIQLTAIFLRPKKEAKLRRYWNWGHWWSGRIALVIASVNIFVGIHLADVDSNKWKVGYGITLGIELLLAVILEALLWLNYVRSKDQPQLPQTALQNRGSSNGTAPTAPLPTYDSTWDSR